jgi:hypothetical protein
MINIRVAHCNIGYIPCLRTAEKPKTRKEDIHQTTESQVSFSANNSYIEFI